MDFIDSEQRILDRVLSLKQSIKEDRASPLDLHELAVCYYYLKSHKQAADVLSNLLEAHPDYLEVASAAALRILCLLLINEYASASKGIEERLKHNPNEPRMLSMKAHILEKTNKEQEAIKVHRRILELDPDNTNSLNALGYLLILHGNPADEKEAILSLKKALEKKPEYPAYLDSFGKLLERKGQVENAKKAYMKALQQSPENSDILENLENLMGKSKQLKTK